MVNVSSLPVEPAEIVNFLGQNLKLKEVCQAIHCQTIVNRVAIDRGLEITVEEIQAEMHRIQSEALLDTPTAVASWLANHWIQMNDWQLGIRQQLLTRKLAENLFASEVERRFAQYQRQFEQILLYRITVPYATLSQELFHRIEEAEISFYEAAHLYNVDSRLRLQCGYEGKKYRQDLEPEIADVIFNAVEGRVLGPFRSSDEAYDLLLVEEFFPATLTPELCEHLIDQLFEEWLARQVGPPRPTQPSND